MEAVVFPNVYERSGEVLQEDAKIFISGHADVGDDRAGKLICDRIIPFDAGRKELWIQFPNQASCLEREQELLTMLADSDGKDPVVLYAAGREEREASSCRTKCKRRSGVDWKIGKKFR